MPTHDLDPRDPKEENLPLGDKVIDNAPESDPLDTEGDEDGLEVEDEDFDDSDDE